MWGVAKKFFWQKMRLYVSSIRNSNSNKFYLTIYQSVAEIWVIKSYKKKCILFFVFYEHRSFFMIGFTYLHSTVYIVHSIDSKADDFKGWMNSSVKWFFFVIFSNILFVLCIVNPKCVEAFLYVKIDKTETATHLIYTCVSMVTPEIRSSLLLFPCWNKFIFFHVMNLALKI